MTYREIVYLCLDELKGMSDDFSFNEDHVMFLCDKYRAFLLKQRYHDDLRKIVPESNYQTMCLDLIEVPAVSGSECEGGSYLRSVKKIPVTMPVGTPRVYPVDYYQGNIALVSRDRMRFVGFNRWMGNIIYCSIAPDGYLYFKSGNPQFLYLEKVRFTAVFENPKEVSSLSCDGDNSQCDVLDRTFPIEEALVPPLVELVVKELGGVEYNPSDETNNANDDLDEMRMRK